MKNKSGKMLVLCFFTFLGGSLVLGDSYLLYDVDFNSSLYTVGQEPPVGGDLAPRETLSRICFGSPRVISGLGGLTDQPLSLSGHGGGGAYDYTQVELFVNGSSGFNFPFSQYDIDMDILIKSSTGDLAILLDTPSVRSVGFTSDGKIRRQVPGSTVYIGTYTKGAVFHLRIHIDLNLERWDIYVNSIKLETANFLANTLESIRVSLGHSTDSSVAIDNIQVAGISDEPMLILESPAGGEGLVAGEEYPITWATLGDIGEVLLEYSTDGGSTWSETEPANAGNTGIYNWVVPAILSDQGLVRIRNRDGSIQDVSKRFFTIHASWTSPRIMTFDPPVKNQETTTVYSGWQENGLCLRTENFMYSYADVSNRPDNGTGAISFISEGGKITMEEPTQQYLFRLLKIDLGEYSTVFNKSKTITFTGYKLDGAQVTQSFTLDGIVDGPGGKQDFQTFMFNSLFTELIRVESTSYPFSMDNLVFAFEKINTPPTAEAGADVMAYADYRNVAAVTLDGSGSMDEDGDELTYAWMWSVEGADHEAQGVQPTIELPVGEYTITLITHDGTEESEPDTVTVTVVGMRQTEVRVTPRVLNQKSQGRFVWAVLSVPPELGAEIDADTPVFLQPGNMPSCRQHHTIQADGTVVILAAFERSEVVNSVTTGEVELFVTGQLDSGPYFGGSDTIQVIKPGNNK